MPDPTAQLVQQIHASPMRLVLVTSGGGSGAIAKLLEVPGGSRTLLEAAVPYAEGAMIHWLGGRPDQFCSPRSARAMAMTAFLRARTYAPEDIPLAGVACTASLSTDRPKRGPLRAHLALQTASQTATWSLDLHKDGRSRAEEELLVSQVLLNIMAEAAELPDRLPLDLLPDERLDHQQTLAPRPWQNLLLGRTAAICQGDGSPSALAILSGAFNPLHAGHQQMMAMGRELLGVSVTPEISILNVDKPPSDYFEIQRRLTPFPEGQSVWLTRAATFDEKSRIFPEATFLVGVDTLRRIGDPRYYGGDRAACEAALKRIAERGCHFLVFGRDVGTGFIRLSDLELPESLEAICREVPASLFREDISSTAIRRAGEW